MEKTGFYVVGLALVAIAVVVSVIGLRFPKFPGSRVGAFAVAGLFVLMVGATTTGAVINAREEQNEHALEEQEATETEATEESESPKELEQQGAAEAKGTSLRLSAPEDGTLAFDTDELDGTAGEVTIEFDNPASIEHDVAIDQDGEELAKSDLVSQGTTEVSADLEPGEYLYYCTVPGHREGGMEGTLTVK